MLIDQRVQLMAIIEGRLNFLCRLSEYKDFSQKLQRICVRQLTDAQANVAIVLV